ncbi:hypothetical protein Adt_11617 [Abeliophyllum distichum]|uniref:Uncharacterized protein n=1 Tax=Abeliophyllum distichum TaxID=126358 RepID=A0ABD1UQ22_9LAMI
MERSKATRECKMVNQNVIEDKDEENIGELVKESLKDECVGKSKFEHREKDENEDDSEKVITVQFGTLPPVMSSNYLLANEFKNNENDEVIMEETTKVAYVLEYGEGTSNGGQVT